MEALTQRSVSAPDALVRAVVRSLQPYEWEESTGALARRFGLAPDQVLRFDMNTAPTAPSGLDEVLHRVATERRINEYFDPQYQRLSEAIAAYNGVGTDTIMIGAGADEVVAVITAAFIEPGGQTAMLVPTFPMCRIYTEQHGGSVLAVPFDDVFQGPVQGLIDAAQHAQLVYLCSPNNPSGTALTLVEVEQIVAGVPCAVAIDEAYVDYHGQTALPLIRHHANLIVVRTFSKAFAMAGARVGYCLAAPPMIGLLNRLRPPNSVSYVSALLAEIMLGRLDDVHGAVAEAIKGREKLHGQLQALGLEVWPSRANFLLARFPPDPGGERNSAQRAAEAHRHLLQQGLVLRSYRDHPRLAGCLRLTVRTAGDNARLLAELPAALALHA